MPTPKVLNKLNDKDRLRFRAKKGDAALAILSVLKSGPRNGYEITQEIKNRTQNVWNISTGTVYPALENLSFEGLVTDSFETQGLFQKDVWKLTSEGVKRLEKQEYDERQLWALFGVDKSGYELNPSTSGTPESLLTRETEKLLEAIELVRRNRPDLVKDLASRVLPEMTKTFYSLLAK